MYQTLHTLGFAARISPFRSSKLILLLFHQVFYARVRYNAYLKPLFSETETMRAECHVCGKFGCAFNIGKCEIDSSILSSTIEK